MILKYVVDYEIIKGLLRVVCNWWCRLKSIGCRDYFVLDSKYFKFG